MKGKLLAIAWLALPMTFLVIGCSSKTGSDESSAIAAVASADGATDLSGTWVLNRELSDKPHRPDSAHGWRMRGDRADSARFARLRERLMDGDFPDSLHGPGRGRGPRGPLRMTIAQTDSTVEITGVRGVTRILYTDGRVMAPQHDRAPEGATIRATWNDDGQLVVEHIGPRGGSRTEIFYLSEIGTQLIVQSRMSPPDGGTVREFRRVYDPAPTTN